MAKEGDYCDLAKEEKVCTLQRCPVSCDKKWSAWSECTNQFVTCGAEGVKNREQIMTKEGDYCDLAKEEKVCTLQRCPVSCDKKWSASSECTNQFVTCGAQGV